MTAAVRVQHQQECEAAVRAQYQQECAAAVRVQHQQECAAADRASREDEDGKNGILAPGIFEVSMLHTDSGVVVKCCKELLVLTQTQRGAACWAEGEGTQQNLAAYFPAELSQADDFELESS